MTLQRKNSGIITIHLEKKNATHETAVQQLGITD